MKRTGSHKRASLRGDPSLRRTPIDPIAWLEAHAPGFKALPAFDRHAIFHFTLLWSWFEASLLGENASASSIVTLTQTWADRERLSVEGFASSLEYFRNRYFQVGQFTSDFDDLRLRSNDCPDLVRSVLSRQTSNSRDSAAALLIVIYRLRNNLFHGIKWAAGIRGQLENFTNANAALIAALTIG